MKITLIVVGRTTSPRLREGIDDFCRRINRYIPFDIQELPDVKTSRKLTSAAQKQAEGEMILSRLQPADRVVLLDEHGAEMTSREFARSLERKAQTVAHRLVFIVGGPYGFSDAVYARADEKMSLSKMTFPHELVRLLFTEQLYRACTIQRNEPYHHD